MKHYYLLVFFLKVVSAKESRIATSTYEMARVAEGEDDLRSDLRPLVEALQKKLDIIRIFADEAAQRMRQAELNPEGYVSNILHSLPMMRRMHQDAPKIMELVIFDVGAELDGIHGYRLNIINKMEFDHAVNGLLRVQNIYDLEAEHMANGLLGLKQYNATLNSLDCLALARHLAEQDNRELASNWYQLALDKYEQTSQSLYQLLNIKRADILKELNALKKSR